MGGKKTRREVNKSGRGVGEMEGRGTKTGGERNKKVNGKNIMIGMKVC